MAVGTAYVSGRSEHVLTDRRDGGYTLYYFSLDTPTASRCTGTCTGYYPPLLLPSGQPKAGGLPGTLGVVEDANGRQVEYNGHLLYRFAADKVPGDAKGNGVYRNGGMWWVATPQVGGTPGSG